MKLRNTTSFTVLTGIALVLFTSFARPDHAPADGCRFTYLWSSDFRNKTMEVSNVFRVAPDYKPSDPRSRCILYIDSADAATARRSSMRDARNGQYQLMLSNYHNQCTK